MGRFRGRCGDERNKERRDSASTPRRGVSGKEPQVDVPQGGRQAAQTKIPEELKKRIDEGAERVRREAEEGRTKWEEEDFVDLLRKCGFPGRKRWDELRWDYSQNTQGFWRKVGKGALVFAQLVFGAIYHITAVLASATKAIVEALASALLEIVKGALKVATKYVLPLAVVVGGTARGCGYLSTRDLNTVVKNKVTYICGDLRDPSTLSSCPPEAVEAAQKEVTKYLPIDKEKLNKALAQVKEGDWQKVLALLFALFFGTPRPRPTVQRPNADVLGFEYRQEEDCRLQNIAELPGSYNGAPLVVERGEESPWWYYAGGYKFTAPREIEGNKICKTNLRVGGFVTEEWASYVPNPRKIEAWVGFVAQEVLPYYDPVRGISSLFERWRTLMQKDRGKILRDLVKKRVLVHRSVLGAAVAGVSDYKNLQWLVNANAQVRRAVLAYLLGVAPVRVRKDKADAFVESVRTLWKSSTGIKRFKEKLSRKVNEGNLRSMMEKSNLEAREALTKLFLVRPDLVGSSFSEEFLREKAQEFAKLHPFAAGGIALDNIYESGEEVGKRR